MHFLLLSWCAVSLVLYISTWIIIFILFLLATTYSVLFLQTHTNIRRSMYIAMVFFFSSLCIIRKPPRHCLLLPKKIIIQMLAIFLNNFFSAIHIHRQQIDTFVNAVHILYALLCVHSLYRWIPNCIVARFIRNNNESCMLSIFEIIQFFQHNDIAIIFFFLFCSLICFIGNWNVLCPQNWFIPWSIRLIPICIMNRMSVSNAQH